MKYLTGYLSAFIDVLCAVSLFAMVDGLVEKRLVAIYGVYIALICGLGGIINVCLEKTLKKS